MKRERLDFLADNPHYTKRFAYRAATIKDVAADLKLDWHTGSLGFVEGLISKIRVIQRCAYGLRGEEYLRLKFSPACYRSYSTPGLYPKTGWAPPKCITPCRQHRTAAAAMRPLVGLGFRRQQRY